MANIPSLNQYVAPYKPVPQITPFTFRDGVTYLDKLEGLNEYINKTIVPFVNENFKELGDEFEEQVNLLIIAVNDAIDQVINDSVDVQDPVVAGIFNNPASATRAVTDVLYAAKSVVDNLVDLVNTGRLSEDSLNDAYMPFATVIDVPKGGTGLSSVSPYRVILSGNDTDGPMTLSNPGTAGQALFSGAGSQAPFFGDLPPVIDDLAAGTVTNRTYSAKKVTDLLAAKAGLNLRGPYASRPAASSVPSGTIYAASDIPEQYMSQGGAWYVIGSGGNQLSYAQITSYVSTTSTSPVAIPGFTQTFVVGERPIDISLACQLQNSTANNVSVVRVFLDGVQQFEVSSSGIDAGRSFTVFGRTRNAGLAPGTAHTITAQFLTGLVGQLDITASTTNPANLSVVTA